MPETAATAAPAEKGRLASRVPQWVGLAATGIAFAFMSWLTWRKWPDLLVDFGMQLYIPWQLASGSVLYRDIMYLPGGPLSQYYHALLFTLFGPSFTVIIVSNHVLAALLIVLLYRGFLACSNQLTATTMALVVVIVFTFSQFANIGNYNYIAPYSHEAFHGLVFAVAALHFLATWLQIQSRRQLSFAGFCMGLVFLTKPEIFLAIGIAAMVAFGLARGSHGNLAHHAKSALLLVGFAALPPIGFFVGFAAVTDVSSALKAVFWTWIPLVTSSVVKNSYYLWSLGLDAPWLRIRKMVLHFALFISVAAFLYWRLRMRPVTAMQRISIVLSMGFVALGAVFVDWVDAGPALPLIASFVLLVLAWQWKSAPSDERGRLIFPLLWVSFALALLAKLGLNCRIWHYGFALAMPAFLSACYFLVELLPRLARRMQHDPLLLRTASLILIGIACFRLLAQSELVYKDKTYPVGDGSDRILAFNPELDPVTGAMTEALNWINQNVGSGESIAALPEGAMLNYLSRRANPTPYLVFMAEVTAFGDDRIFAAYKAGDPDYVLLVHRDSSEYGVEFFGQKKGYGLDMMQWIHRNYDPVHLIGHEPLKNHLFGIKIFKRKPASP